MKNRVNILIAGLCVVGCFFWRVAPLAAQSEPIEVTAWLITDAMKITVPSTTLPKVAQLRKSCHYAGVERIETIQDALACLNTARIVADGLVEIVMVRSPKQPYSTVKLFHPDSDRIFIRGGCHQHDSHDCKITFQKSKVGFSIDHHHEIGGISDFILIGQGGHAGIEVKNNASLIAKHMQISGFYDGIYVSGNSNAQLNDIRTENNSQGITAAWNSHILAANLTVKGAINSFHNSSFEMIGYNHAHRANVHALSEMQCRDQCIFQEVDIKGYSATNIVSASKP